MRFYQFDCGQITRQHFRFFKFWFRINEIFFKKEKFKRAVIHTEAFIYDNNRLNLKYPIFECNTFSIKVFNLLKQ